VTHTAPFFGIEKALSDCPGPPNGLVDEWSFRNVRSAKYRLRSVDDIAAARTAGADLGDTAARLSALSASLILDFEDPLSPFPTAAQNLQVGHCRKPSRFRDESAWADIFPFRYVAKTLFLSARGAGTHGYPPEKKERNERSCVNPQNVSVGWLRSFAARFL